MKRESRGIIYRKEDSRKKEQSLIIHQFHAMHISNREVHKTVSSLSVREICLYNVSDWDGKGGNTGFCSRQMLDCGRATLHNHCSPVPASERKQCCTFFIYLFIFFNSSFIAGNDSHWSLFGFLLHVVQDILWQKK